MNRETRANHVPSAKDALRRQAEGGTPLCPTLSLPHQHLSEIRQSRRKRSIPSLTGIRGAAALWVMMHHFYIPVAGYLAIPFVLHSSFLANGFRAVDLFFILSGFILMLVHGEEFAVPTRAAIKRFLILRGLRVYPLNTIILLLMVPLALLEPGYVHYARLFTEPKFAYKLHNMSWPGFVQSLLLVQTWTVAKLGEWNGPSWSLSAEVLGYILFPTLAFYVLRLRHAWIGHLLALMSLVATGAILFLTHHMFDNPTGTMGALRMMGGFVAGIALGRAAMLDTDPAQRSMTMLTVSAVGAGVIMLIIPAFSPLLSLAFAWLIFGLYHQSGPVDRLLSSRIMLWLGAVSFPLYMVHETMFRIFQWCMQSEMMAFRWDARLAMLALLVSSMFLMAWILHRTVERGSHRLARRVAATIR